MEIQTGLKKSNPLRYTYGILLGLLFKFTLDVFFGLTYDRYSVIQPLSHYLFAILITYFVFEVLIRVNKQINKRYNWDQNTIQRFNQQLLINSGLAILIVFLIRILYRRIIEDNSYVVARDEIAILFFVFFTILGFVIAELSLFMLHKWQFNLAQLERFKKENAEYRFELLQSQLNPHFLFNSLNTLSALVYENQDQAGLFIRKLSDVYRYILDQKDKDLITLKTEIDFANSYIMLMKLRFEDNLHINIQENIENENYSLAPLSVQLLLENAFKHNVVSKKKPLHIEVFLEESYLVVRNNIQPKLSTEKSHQMGLKNIGSRYKFLSDKEIIIEDTGGFFIVKLPLISIKKSGQ